MTTQATWNKQVIASSEACIAVEGNAYFPPDAIDMRFFVPSSHSSVCSWKGTANYFDVVVDGKTNPNAAWVYRDPKSAASPITGYVAFWKGVEVTGGELAKVMQR
jgi:uncharacterized protein (DUF427 family)